MNINIENITHMLAEGGYPHHVFREFGQAGTDALVALLDGVRLVYKVCPPDLLKKELMVFRPVSGQSQENILSSLPNAASFLDINSLAQFILANKTDEVCMVELLDDRTYLAAHVSSSECKFDDFRERCVVYRYVVNQNTPNEEHILAGEYDGVILRASSALASNFAEPTYSGLEDALNQYRTTAGESRCKILQGVWENGVSGPRLILVNRPESIMRDSLGQFLQAVLGTKASVRPEQNTDETKPVDLRIEWYGSDASALIEIKWLGRSTAKPRDGSSNGYTDYGPARAQSGAAQLCDYLDRDRLHSRSIKPLGYLVVLDARRRNVKGPTDLLCKEDAFWFESKEIDYNPKFEIERDDFVAPTRFFMRPRESNLLIEQ